MNPTRTVVDPQPPPVPPQPHRPSTSCDRHPEENFTGFCPSCLCERLAVLHPNTTSASSSSSSRKPPTSSTAAAALKAIFKPSSSSSNSTGGGPSNNNNKQARPTTSFCPELRRTKSFSASKNEGFSGVFEPQRKSCDVRGRNTLWCLFNQDDGRNPNKKDQSTNTTTDVVETRNVAGPSSSFRGPVFEFKEEEEDDEDDYEEEEQRNDVGQFVISDHQQQQRNAVEIGGVPEIVEEEEYDDDIQQVVQLQQSAAAPVVQFPEEMRPMKDHIDMDAQTKKRDLKEIAGSFWSAASVFSKKLQKWRQKQKLKKRRSGGGSATLPVEKPIGRQFRETQSEIADYGFGRRSCDTDPRFSLDAGRMSFDDPRYSFDEPRASWDGHLLGRPAFTRMPTMLSVVEDSPVVVVSRTDAQIPVEEAIHSINEADPAVPGGSLQTQSYYLDSSSRRRKSLDAGRKSLDAGRKSLDSGRKSLDRSSSIRRTAAAVVAEIDEMKSVSNSKVSPTDYFHGGSKLVVPDRDHSRDSNSNSNSNSLRDDCSETFEMAFRVGDPVLVRGGGDSASVIGNGERKEYKQKSKRWSKGWNIWNFINRRSGNKEDDEDRYSSRPNGVDRSFSESWPELRGRGGERNGEAKGGFNPKITRSNSSASWRNSRSFGSGVFGSMRRNDAVEPTVNVNGNGCANGSFNGNGSGNGRKKKEEFVLERNRSARFSPSHIDNGLLRFYLTPSWRNGGGAGKSRSNPAHSIARSVLRLY